MTQKFGARPNYHATTKIWNEIDGKGWGARFA